MLPYLIFAVTLLGISDSYTPFLLPTLYCLTLEIWRSQVAFLTFLASGFLLVSANPKLRARLEDGAREKLSTSKNSCSCCCSSEGGITANSAASAVETFCYLHYELGRGNSENSVPEATTAFAAQKQDNRCEPRSIRGFQMAPRHQPLLFLCKQFPVLNSSCLKYLPWSLLSLLNLE